MKSIKMKCLFLIFCTLTILVLSSCATQPVLVPFYLSGTPSKISPKLPLRVGVEKFSEAKQFSLDLKNIIPSILPQTTISDGFTDSFVNYLFQSNLFKSIHKQPFNSEDVDIIWVGRILEIQTEEPDFDSAMGGAIFRGLTIIGTLVPQYQKVITTVELEFNVNSAKGERIKTYMEKTSTTNEIQTLGVGASGSVINLLKRLGLMESMTKTFAKLLTNIVRDKEELLGVLAQNSR